MKFEKQCVNEECPMALASALIVGKECPVSDGWCPINLQRKVAGSDAVYSERALLVAFLSTIFRSGVERTDPSPGFEYCIYMDTPFGQVSWHIADKDLHLFDHVARDRGWKWDGHDNATKEDRIKKSMAWLLTKTITFV